MKRLSILGSTGSIGCNTLKIVEMLPERLGISALAGGNNVGLLAEQIKQFSPEIVSVFNEKRAHELKNLLTSARNVEIVYGEEGYRMAATHEDVDMVVSAMVGAAGLVPTMAAIDSGKDIALANKETLVMAGEIVMKRASLNGARILPIDSEHSAIFQCIAGNRREDLDKIFLTASGGPFLNRSGDEFDNIKPEDALEHPTWQMGNKISIDSATLMNKGFEVVEAKYLFNISHKKIEILIHPQSVIHSMVAFRDGSILAQLGIPDMKGAIAYAISCPERFPIKQPLPDFPNIGALTFECPDFGRFPCLNLAFEACETGETMPAVLNAANEVAVQAFLDSCISFAKIPWVIQETMAQHNVVKDPVLSDILNSDRWAREKAEEKIGGLKI
jgi:1-deoxy-D-xylulose-5-phosphate reductoisomerase